MPTAQHGWNILQRGLYIPVSVDETSIGACRVYYDDPQYLTHADAKHPDGRSLT